MQGGLLSDVQREIRRARRRQESELNLVSMIDVLTVLVFFLLINQLGVSVLGIELPGPAKTAAATPPQELSVVVRGDGMTLANHGKPIAVFPRTGERYDLTALASKLEGLKKAVPDNTHISLMFTPDVPYQTLVMLMDTVRTSQTAAATPLYPDISVGLAPGGPSSASLPPNSTGVRNGKPA